MFQTFCFQTLQPNEAPRLTVVRLRTAVLSTKTIATFVITEYPTVVAAMWKLAGGNRRAHM